MIARLQRKFIYRPLRGKVNLDAAAVPSGVVREVRVRTDDGLTLHGWYAASRQPVSNGDPAQRPLVIFFPGNSGHRGCRHKDCELFTQIGADLLLVDYRGYGENPGRPCEASLAADARAIWRHAIERMASPPGRIVLFGGSLGGGVATGLAHELCAQASLPAGLILRATFTSIADAGQARYPWLPVRRLLVERFPSIERIAHVTCPLLVVHGAADRVVPIEQGRRLFAAAQPQSVCGVEKRFVELPASGHHDIIHTGWEEMRAEFARFLAEISNGRRRSTEMAETQDEFIPRNH
ncbi:MAG: alpha/beta hydrolase [Planctomycetaceae bacterium]